MYWISQLLHLMKWGGEGRLLRHGGFSENRLFSRVCTGRQILRVKAEKSEMEGSQEFRCSCWTSEGSRLLLTLR